MSPAESASVSAAVQLSPATPQVDALVFGAAPDTQALSVQGAKYPDMQLLDAPTLYYEGTGRDYVVDVDEDGYAVSITTIAGGALDAGGTPNATYRKAFFDADDVSEWFVGSSQQTRFTCDCGSGAAATNFETEGRSEIGGTPFPLATLQAVANGTSFTRAIQQPVSAVRASLTGVTGPVKILVQDAT
jgi:hypothetical protein